MNQFTTIKRTLVAVILAIAMIFSVSTIAAATAVEEYAHGELAYKHLEFIDENLPERIAFTPRERETAEWIVYELIKMGHSLDNIYIQKFSASEHTHRMINFMWAPFGEELELLNYSQNVILTIPGVSDKTIIVGAHYDSVDNNGISDNASGTVVLLESAQRMLYLENYYTIIYIFFGAEEIGLYGSAYYVDSLTEAEMENIVLMINIDVIFDGSVLFYAAGFHDIETSEMGSTEVTLLIDEIAQSLNEELGLGFVRQHNGIYQSSDNLPFVWAGFNVVTFYAVDNYEPMPPSMMSFFLERVLLVEAMVYGTDDPELIEAINEQRESLEFELWLGLDNKEDLLRWLGSIEQRIEEERNPIFIISMTKEVEAINRLIAVLEHPKMEEFEFQHEFTRHLSFLEELLLIEALVKGTDDLELIELIHEHSESLKWTLSWYTSMEMEWLLEDIKRIEQQLREEENPDFIEWLLEDLERTQRMIALLEHPKMQELEFTVQGPIFSLEEMLLLEAMVYGTDDPELIKTIYEQREWLERILWWYLDDTERLSKSIESMERQINELDNPILVEWLQEDLEMAKRVVALIEYAEMGEFEFIFPKPLSFQKMILLIEAMVYGTYDPELIELIYANREELEWTLAIYDNIGIERLLKDIEFIEQLIKEETDPAFIETWMRHLEELQKMLAVLESPQMEQFVFEYEFDFGNWWGLGFGYVLHTPNDNLTFINENWPGLIERALNSYSIFLENILTLPAQSLELTN